MGSNDGESEAIRNARKNQKRESMKQQKAREATDQKRRRNRGNN